MQFKPPLYVRIVKYEGLFLLLLMWIAPVWTVCYANVHCFSSLDASSVDRIAWNILIAMITVFSVSFTVAFFQHIYRRFFASIIITDSEIIWKCVFCKTRVLIRSDCRYIGVELEDTRYKHLAYPFVYFSAITYPEEHIHAINKLKVTDAFIKMWYTDVLADFLLKEFPKEKTGKVQYYCEKQRRELREQQKKKR